MVKVHSLDSTTAFKESRISLIFQIFPSEELLEMPLNPSPVFIDVYTPCAFPKLMAG